MIPNGTFLSTTQIVAEVTLPGLAWYSRSNFRASRRGTNVAGCSSNLRSDLITIDGPRRCKLSGQSLRARTYSLVR